MKVLQVNKFFYKKGGSEAYFFSLSDLLESKGHQVVYFSMKDENNLPCDQSKYFIDNVDYTSASIKTRLHNALKIFYNFEARRNIERLVDKEKPDIAHLHIFQHQITISVSLELEEACSLLFSIFLNGRTSGDGAPPEAVIEVGDRLKQRVTVVPGDEFTPHKFRVSLPQGENELRIHSVNDGGPINKKTGTNRDLFIEKIVIER